MTKSKTANKLSKSFFIVRNRNTDEKRKTNLPARPILSPNFGLVRKNRFKIITVKGVTSIDLHQKEKLKK